MAKGKKAKGKKQAKKAKPIKTRLSKARPKAKPRKAKPSKPEPTVGSLEKNSIEIAAEITAVRKKILQNEIALKAKIDAKISAEESLQRLLMKSFKDEKSLLSRIKLGTAKKQASLKQQILSLERINKVYDEKKARITDAKKRHAALKKQLEMVEKKSGAW